MAYHWDVFVNGELKYRATWTDGELRRQGYRWSKKHDGFVRRGSNVVVKAHSF